MKLGDLVIVRKLRKKGTLERALAQGRWRVRVDSFTIICHATELDEIAPTTSRVRGKKAQRARSPSPFATPRGGGRSVVDLHGHTKDYALETLARAVNAAILAGADELHVLHGRGRGVLQAAVVSWAKATSVVVGVHGHPQNPGITVLTF